jgi:hypothetical protein
VNSFRKGDRVTWSSHGGTATGEVVRNVNVDGHARRQQNGRMDDDRAATVAVAHPCVTLGVVTANVARVA